VITIAVILSLLLALITLVISVVKAALDSVESHKAESLGFVRLLISGIFAVVVGQTISPTGITWYWTVVASTLLMASLLIASQVLGKKFGPQPIGEKLVKATSPIVNSIHLLFTPIAFREVEIPEEFEQELLDSVEEFGETIVREIMVPRVDMATVDADFTLAKSMSVFLRRGYSRLPIVGKNIDDISGILYLKDVARILHESPSKMEQTKAVDIARPVIFIPESKPVDDLLREMQISSTHIAVIVDEYGGVAGLATMEDVIEEIVGEISDEYDRDVADVDDLGDGSYRVIASYSLAELGEFLGIELEDEDVDSIGGLFTKQLGRLPAKGDESKFSGLVVSVDRIEGRRKRLITVIVSKDQDLEDAQSAFDQQEQN